MIFPRIILLILVLNFSKTVKGQKNCKYKIDTAEILSNKKLDSFINSFETDSFIISNNKKDIPNFIKRSLNCFANGFSIANPDKAYEAGGAKTPGLFKSLPDRQLRFLANSKDMIVIIYLKGGFGVQKRIVFIKYQAKKIVNLWCGNYLYLVETKQLILEHFKDAKNKHWALNGDKIYF